MKNLYILKSLNIAGSDGLLLKKALSDSDAIIFAQNRYFISKSESKKIALLPSPSGNYLNRFFQLFQISYKLNNELKDFEFSEIFCGSSELAFVVLSLTKLNAQKKVFLFSDITQFHQLKILKYIVYIMEITLLAFNWIPAVTSYGFIRSYFIKLPFYKKFIYVHNTLTFTSDENYDNKILVNKNNFKIAWVGLLRCNKSLKLLLKLINENCSSFSILIAGSILYSKVIKEFAMRSNYITYGAYHESELQMFYKSADFCWCCDWSLANNSALLIPNRFYHAIYFGKPIIASQNSELSRVVSIYNIGISIPDDIEKSSEILKNINLSNYNNWLTNIKYIRNFMPIENTYNVIEVASELDGGKYPSGNIFSLSDFQINNLMKNSLGELYD